MYTHTTKQRVKYSDTDQMGFMHHSNYVRYYETSRWELLRSIGISYKSIEEDNYLLPVTNMTFRFIKPAFYDDLLTIETTLNEIKGAQMFFTYKMYNSAHDLINEAKTVVAFILKENRQPCHPPEHIMNAFHSIDENKESAFQTKFH